MDRNLDGKRVGHSYFFFCEASPSPPGSRFKGKHLIPGEEPAPRSGWMALTGVVVAALAVGLAIGRFLLP